MEADQGAAAAAGIRHRTVEANGISVHVAEAGPEDGKAVLFLHGFPELWYSWRHQMAHLASRGYRCVAPDLRGYGGTEAPPDVQAYSAFHVVGDAVALLDALGITKVFVVGHDWGAIIAWYLCLFRPDRVTALVNTSVAFMRSVFIRTGPNAVKTTDHFNRAYGPTYYICRFQVGLHAVPATPGQQPASGQSTPSPGGGPGVAPSSPRAPQEEGQGRLGRRPSQSPSWRRSRSPAPSPPSGVSASRSGSVQGASSPSTPASRSSSPASGRSSSPCSSPPPPAAPVLHPPLTIPPPVAQPPVRRSGRFATTEGGVEATDEDVMQRAMRRKAEKNLDTAGHLQMYRYSPFVVTSSASGEPRPVYGGLYTVGGYGEGYFFPTWVAA